MGSFPFEGASESIAIVAMAGRFPDARDTEAFWENIRNGVESISRFSDEELIAAGVEPSLLSSPSYVKAGAVLDDADLFDASFFGYSPREARLIDPQQRIFLECCWETLERAGYDSRQYGGSIGVFAGSSPSTYLLSNLVRHEGAEAADEILVQLGNSSDFLANRVAYKLNLKGPAVAVQSSCSTSLVAVHLACQSLLNFESDMALAGGASVSVPMKSGYVYKEGGIYSPDGHCRAFDARAGGTVGGNGVGVVLLKRLEDAVRQNDPVLAVIRGSAINNDGSDKIGYTAPGVHGQMEVILAAQAAARVSPDTITYVETHGTGTSVGDPIEIAALTAAFRAGTDKSGFCAIGSLKSNIGHLDAAAGVAGLIKTVLALQHRLIPPSVNFESANPEIDFDNSPFRVSTRAVPWEADGPLRAGVSSFGIGGTNAHVILEEAPSPRSEPAPGPGRRRQLVLLSAKTETALKAMAGRLGAQLEQQPGIRLPDVAYTLQRGRHRFPHRMMLVCDRNERESRARALRAGSGEGIVSVNHDATNAPVAFMFPGQGAQYPGMGAGLYEDEPEFRSEVDRCCALLEPHLGKDLRTVIMPDRPGEEESARELNQTVFAQPALFVVEYALAKLWMSWGVGPTAMIGHSIGQFVAACLAEVFSLEDTLRLVAARGRLMQEIEPGEMIAVALPREELARLLGDQVSLAAVNEPSACVASGPTEAIRALKRTLEQDDVAVRRLHTSHAFHSAMMEPVVDRFTDQVRTADLHPPRIPFICNLTGEQITAENATDPRYWARLIRQPVHFSAGLQRLLEQPDAALLEVGPGRTLTSLAIQHRSSAAGRQIVPSMRHPREDVPDGEFLLGSLGRLWAAGVDVDWEAVHGEAQPRRIELPTYPFERQRHWVEPRPLPEAGSPAAPRKAADISDWFYVPSWKRADAAGPDVTPNPEGKWLVFAELSEPASLLTNRLEAAGADVAVVRAGQRTRQVDERLYSLDPSRSESYRELFDLLDARDWYPDRIVHLWNLAPEEPIGDPERLEPVQDLGFFSLLSLAQVVGRRPDRRPPEITLVTAGTMDVFGNEALQPERATAAGACRVIAQEVAGLACRHIDAVFPSTGVERDKLAAQLLAEFFRPEREPTVALRAGRRWIPIYERLQQEGEAGSLLRDRGSYVVTGGGGAIGLEVAEYLARTVNARLVLLGRSGLPPRDQWDAILGSHGEKSVAARQVGKLKSIEAHGGRILALQADVASETEMEAAFDAAEDHFGAVHGVVHAAGAATEAAVVLAAGRAECRDQFRPKLAGLMTLAEVVRDRDLDFCLVQSSLSSILGGLGFAAYSAAHVFMDTFVRRQNREASCPWLIVNWDNWLNWKDSKVSLATPESAYFMTPEEAHRALQRVLAGDSTEIVVSTGDLEERLVRWVRSGEPAAAAASGAHAGPDETRSEPPAGSETERILVEAWTRTLGIEQVGVEDNFFELGGDSVLGIQVVAKAALEGVKITPAQIFEHPTIAGLAAVARIGGPGQSARGPVTGEVPLTPIQKWFFETVRVEPHHFNLPILLEVPQPVDAKALEGAVGAVVEHHDALRLSYSPESGGFRQVNEPPGEPPGIARVDIGELPEERRREALEANAADAQASLDLSGGPLMRLILFDQGPTAPALLLWVVHHLLVDLVSWRILLEDLDTAYRQIRVGERASLPPKTTSFKEWAEHCQQYANGEAVAAELDYWEAQTEREAGALPVDCRRGENTEGSARIIRIALNEQETSALLTEVPGALRCRVNDVLVTALAKSLARWTRQSSVLLDLEGHGRDGAGDGLDLSRTVGWFTALYPVLLRLEDSSSRLGLLSSIKEQLRSVPRGGVGFGTLKYLNEDPGLRARMDQLKPPRISFLYQGSSSPQPARNSSIRLLVGKSPGPAVSPHAKRAHLLQVGCFVDSGRLKTEWIYSSNVHRRDTVERLARGFIDELVPFTRPQEQSQEATIAPTDFPGAQLSRKELDALLSKIDRS